VEDAEISGWLQHGDTLIEPTSGNTRPTLVFCLNMAARLILQQSYTPSAQYLLEWLPISTWVDFKIAILTYIPLSVRDAPIISYSSAA